VTPGTFPRTTSLKGWLDPNTTFEEVAHELLTDDTHKPGFIIASPATMTGGWSKTFADQMIGEERHAVVFSGFLPRDDRLGGDPLTRLRKGSMYPFDRARRIDCDWEHVSLSAHAPADDLRMLGRSLAERADGQVTFACVHGSQAAQQALADDLGALDKVASARSLLNNQPLTTSR
jgi:Cft2 family RNA processing exonuclease